MMGAEALRGVHELQVTQSILDTVLEAARSNSLRSVSRIRLVVGELHELRQEWIQRYFDYLSEGSAAEGAKILVETIPAALGCLDCGFEVQLHDAARCPECRGANLSLVRGREFLIQEMEGQ